MPRPIPLRPTHLQIDLDALTHNVGIVRERSTAVSGTSGPRRLMAILKADGYGHGLVPSALTFRSVGVDYFGVAFLEEGVALRNAGINDPILVLGGLVGYQAAHFLDYDLELTASSLYKAKQISDAALKLNTVAKVHVKIDTGMRRIGVRPENAVSFVRAAQQLPGVKVVGVFSHMVGGDQALNEGQIREFEGLIDELAADNIKPPLVHLSNSAAIFRSEPAPSSCNLVRPGISLYGVPPFPQGPQHTAADITPAMSVHTQVVYFKGIRRGQGIGYGHTWHAPCDGWLATLPVGYGDGYPRSLSNKADVLIRGQRYPVVGQISMDQLAVWVGHNQFDVGTPVVLLGKQGHNEVSAWELASHAGTIAYEIMCGWTPRVPRVYVGDGASTLPTGYGISSDI